MQSIVALLLVLCTQSTRAVHRQNEQQQQQQQHQHGRRLTPNFPGDDGHRRDVEVPVPTDPEEHRVKAEELPLFDGSLETFQYAGLLPASANKDKYFFYWFFYPEIPDGFTGRDDDIPLLIWLNGGPGCSSMDGLFLENGPLHLVQEGGEWKLTARPHSWHTSPAYVVYVDQPVGTGLSFTTSKLYPRNDPEVNTDFYYWLTEFLTLHANVLLNDDQTAMRRPFYFSGESHAGHYIPSMMAHIQAQNDNTKHPPKFQMRLSGAAIGNGWVDPYHQYAAAAAAYGHGLVGMAQQAAMDVKEKECQANLAKGKYVTNVCFNLMDDVVDQSYGSSSKYKVSQYDIRQQELKHGSRTFPPGHKDVEQYLGGRGGPSSMKSNVDEVLAAIHATPSKQAGQRFQECTDPPYNALSHQDGLGVTQDVTSLLDDPGNIRLLFFNGIMDLICNHVGNEVLLDKLVWSHQKDWITAPRYAWKSNGNELAGYAKEFQNLGFLKLMNSGHMAPLDQPEICLDMMKTFMYGKLFTSSQQKLDRAVPGESNDSGPACEACPTCPIIGPTDDEGTAESNSATTPDGTTTDDSVLKFVVAHSWIGAIFTVLVFLASCVVFRRRNPGVGGTRYGGVVEMKYRDEPSFRDDDDSVSSAPAELPAKGGSII